MSRTLGISGSFWNEFVLGPAFFQPTTVTQGGSRRALGSCRQSSVSPRLRPRPGWIPALNRRRRPHGPPRIGLRGRPHPAPGRAHRGPQRTRERAEGHAPLQLGSPRPAPAQPIAGPTRLPPPAQTSALEELDCSGSLPQGWLPRELLARH